MEVIALIVAFGLFWYFKRKLQKKAVTVPPPPPEGDIETGKDFVIAFLAGKLAFNEGVPFENNPGHDEPDSAGAQGWSYGWITAANAAQARSKQ
jgi:hypothetical protein